MLIDFMSELRNENMPLRKTMKKLGTLAIGVVEATPVVWENRLVRLETNHAKYLHELNPCVEFPKLDESSCRFVDMATEEATPYFAPGHNYGCCYTENSKMYVYSMNERKKGECVDVFVSEDLIHWEESTAVTLPEGLRSFNTSVCKGLNRYIMAIEVGGEHPIAKDSFTCIFAESNDLIHWNLLPIEEYCYEVSQCTACPVIRYHDGYYYMIYTTGMPYFRWVPYIVRARDLKEFEIGLTNPVMYPCPDDKMVIHSDKYSKEQIACIENGINCNNSDVDVCEYNGKTIILYCWGNQLNRQNLAMAEYDGMEEEFFKSFFV